MLVKGLKQPTNLTINFSPSPKQYDMWKLLQPNYCPHCGGSIELVEVSRDERGLPVHAPRCVKCHSRELPQIILGGGAGGGGKALALTEDVLTPNGFKKMGEMKVGDVVCTPNGGTAKVVAVHPQGVVPLWKITFSDGITVKCCSDHIWKMKAKKDGIEREILADTKHIRRLFLDKYMMSVDYTKPVPQEGKYDSFVHPYVLGFFAASTRPPGLVGIEKDKTALIKRLNSFLPKGCVMFKMRDNDYTVNDDGMDEYTYKNSPFFNELERLYLMLPRHRKIVPEFIFTCDIETRLAFVQGMMDSSGAKTTNGRCSFVTTSKLLAKGFERLVRSLGAYGHMTTHTDFYVAYHHVFFNSLDKANFMTAKSKLVNIKPTFKKSVRKIVSIEAAGEEEAQCITIDSEDGMFLTNGYLPTHNSFVGSAWIVSSCLRFPDSRAVVARKTLKALKGSTFNTIKLILRTWGLVEGENYKINNLDGIVTFYNGSTISLIELEDLPSDPEFERLGSNLHYSYPS